MSPEEEKISASAEDKRTGYPTPAPLSHLRESSRQRIQRVERSLILASAIVLLLLGAFHVLVGGPLWGSILAWFLGMAIAISLISLTFRGIWRRERQSQAMLTLGVELNQLSPAEIDWEVFLPTLQSAGEVKGIGLYLANFSTGKLQLTYCTRGCAGLPLPSVLSQEAGGEELKGILPSGTMVFPCRYEGSWLNGIIVVLPQHNPLRTESQTMLLLVAELIASTIARQKIHRELTLLSTTDSLTGLYNRSYFSQALEQEFNHSRRYSSLLAFLHADLDNLKKINDTYGHLVGDEALVKVAEALRQSLRKSDIVARVGGDEFMVILPETGEEGAEAAARRIVANLSSCPLHTGEITLQVSQGLAVLCQEDKSIEDLMQRADMALYQAKSSGEGIVMAKEAAEK